MPLLEEGQIIQNTYEVERKLGEGAFAEVYRVKHRFLGRQAMKVFKAVGMPLQEIEDMLSEALLLSRMGHPNIVRVFDANITETSKGQSGFFTMEYVAGGSLEKFWQSHGNSFVPVETTKKILCQICNGLAIAHLEKPPIIHRDIKPQNILIGYDDKGIRARISDFGLAKRVNPLSLMVTALGTPIFKPPEIYIDKKSDSCAGDVWALGCTLYLLLTDRHPFSTNCEDGIIEFSNYAKPMILPSRLNMLVNDEMDHIILKSLAIDPKKRYKNASELHSDLITWKPFKPKENLQKTINRNADFTKTAIGVHTPINIDYAKKLANSAMELSRHADSLNEAADLLEEAFTKWPELRKKYEYKLKLWRKGIVL